MKALVLAMASLVFASLLLGGVAAAHPIQQPHAAPLAQTAEPTPRPQVLVNSPTSYNGPTQVYDDGATVGRMIALVVFMVTILVLTSAILLTRRRDR